MTVSATAPDAATIDAAITDAATAELIPQLAGPAFLPGDAGYDEERTGFNLTVNHHPAVIVGATGAADVMAAVRFAGAHGLAVAVQATGHTAALPADGAVLITTRRMQGLRVDPTTRTARVEAGVIWERVIHEAAPFGLAPLNGSSPRTGVVGYTLGGGIGLMARAYGFAADRVRNLDVVTADGQLLHVTPEDEPDLYWGLCGGKGNLGIVTSIEFDLLPVARLYGGGLFFAGAGAAAVLHAYVQWCTTAPDEVTSSVALMRFPPVPALPEPLRGQFVVHVRLAYLGSPEDGEKLIAPLRQSATPVIDTVGEMPYAAIGTIHSDPGAPVPAVECGAYLRDFDAGAVEALLEVAGPGVDCPLHMVEIRHIGGALAHRFGPPNAVGQRGWPYGLCAIGLGTPDEAAAVDEALNAMVATFAPWDSGRSYLNVYGGRDVDPERVRLAFDDADYARLAAIKAAYDPANMFRINHNVPPAPTS